MSSTDSSADDHAYFQAIESSFIRWRGAPLLLSPSDWQLARQWHRQGIPLELVLETLEQVFVTRQARGAKGRVQGLRYCAPAVEKAWSARQELMATGERQAPPKLDLTERLHGLAKTLMETKERPEGPGRPSRGSRRSTGRGRSRVGGSRSRDDSPGHGRSQRRKPDDNPGGDRGVVGEARLEAR